MVSFHIFPIFFNKESYPRKIVLPTFRFHCKLQGWSGVYRNLNQDFSRLAIPPLLVPHRSSLGHSVARSPFGPHSLHLPYFQKSTKSEDCAEFWLQSDLNCVWTQNHSQIHDGIMLSRSTEMSVELPKKAYISTMYGMQSCRCTTYSYKIFYT